MYEILDVNQKEEDFLNKTNLSKFFLNTEAVKLTFFGLLPLELRKKVDETTNKMRFDGYDKNVSNSPFLYGMYNILFNARTNCFAGCETLTFDRFYIKIKNSSFENFPLSKEEVKIMMTHASPAPFGKGKQTILDTNVRNCLQIDAKDLEIWFVYDLLSQAEGKIEEYFGIQRNCFESKLYKLLIYEKGGFFKPHRDSEKCQNMFGTLIITLPSYYKGGELEIQHEDKKQAFCLDGYRSEMANCIFFYADCVHELKPITEGYRVCLVYQLFYVDDSLPPNTNTEENCEKLGSYLRLWELESFGKKNNYPKSIIFPLSHEYSESSLYFQNLKGNDKITMNLLQKAVERNRKSFLISLNLITYEEEAYEKKENDVEKYERRYGMYDCRETCNVEITLSNTVCHRSVPFPYEIDCFQESIVPKFYFKVVEEDEKENSVYTGNESTLDKYTYYKGCVVIWQIPERKRFRYSSTFFKESALYHLVFKLKSDPRMDYYSAVALNKEKTKTEDDFKELIRKYDKVISPETLFDLLVIFGDIDFFVEMSAKNLSRITNEKWFSYCFQLAKNQEEFLQILTLCWKKKLDHPSLMFYNFLFWQSTGFFSNNNAVHYQNPLIIKDHVFSMALKLVPLLLDLQKEDKEEDPPFLVCLEFLARKEKNMKNESKQASIYLEQYTQMLHERKFTSSFYFSQKIFGSS